MRCELWPAGVAIPAYVRELYECAFPLNERRPWQPQQQLVNQGKLQLLELTRDNIFTGFVFLWHLSDFIFIEHFAIAAADRGKGQGSAVMQLLANTFSCIVLETEPEEKSKLAARRVAFYEKHGYSRFPYPYQQPAYAPGYAVQEMLLMYHCKENKQPDFERIKNGIYQLVYAAAD